MKPLSSFPQSATSVPWGDILVFFAGVSLPHYFSASSSRWELVALQRFRIYIYFFLVAQKSVSHHAGAHKERLFVVVGHRPLSLVARVCWRRFVFCCCCCVNDRLKFRAISTMDIFNTIRSAVFSLSLSICARRVRIATFARMAVFERRIWCWLTRCSLFSFSLKYISFIPY